MKSIITKINEQKVNNLPKWGKAKYSVIIVDLNNNDIQTQLFENYKDYEKFLMTIEPKYWDDCQGGPSISDQVASMDGEENGSSLQMCYDVNHKKYYILSAISLW